MRKPTAFRLDEITDARLDQLAAAFTTTRTEVIRQAVRLLHKREGLADAKAATKGKG